MSLEQEKPMPIVACGINHKTAPVALREKVVFQKEKLGLYLHDLMVQENIHEAVLLSTCNRSELYCDTADEGKLMDWFCRQHAICASELQSVWYCYSDQEALQHIMSVASGLDSMILGEPEILGQMKEAFSESCAAGCIGPKFNRLFQQVFAITKDIRTSTGIGACPVSIASATMHLAKKNAIVPLEQARLLLVGAGDTIQLILRYLENHPPKKLIIANRSLENSLQLARYYSAECIAFDTLSDELLKTDMVITATGSATPIISKKMFDGRTKPLCIIDIAVPRDVETTVAELNAIQLFSIDDLKTIIHHNVNGREHAAEKAHQVIREKCKEFIIWQDSLEQVASTISTYRKQIEELSDAELTKAARQLKRGDNPMDVLANFAHAFTNKLLHNPSIQLRQAGIEGRIELLEWAQQLFAISESKSESL